MMEVDENHIKRSKTGQPEAIPSGLSRQKNRNLDFEKMKSFLKTEI